MSDAVSRLAGVLMVMVFKHTSRLYVWVAVHGGEGRGVGGGVSGGLECLKVRQEAGLRASWSRAGHAKNKERGRWKPK